MRESEAYDEDVGVLLVLLTTLFGETGDFSTLDQPLIEERPESDLAVPILTDVDLTIFFGESLGDFGECGVRGLKRPCCSVDGEVIDVVVAVAEAPSNAEGLLGILAPALTPVSAGDIKKASPLSRGAGGGGLAGEGEGVIRLSDRSRSILPPPPI
jgi:hypothetical protein